MADLGKSLENDFNLRTLCLPVSYEESMSELSQLIEKDLPDLVVSFGVAKGRAQISLEERAKNRIESDREDSSGVAPPEEEVLSGQH